MQHFTRLWVCKNSAARVFRRQYRRVCILILRAVPDGDIASACKFLDPAQTVIHPISDTRAKQRSLRTCFCAKAEAVQPIAVNMRLIIHEVPFKRLNQFCSIFDRDDPVVAGRRQKNRAGSFIDQFAGIRCIRQAIGKRLPDRKPIAGDHSIRPFFCGRRSRGDQMPARRQTNRYHAVGTNMQVFLMCRQIFHRRFKILQRIRPAAVFSNGISKNKCRIAAFVIGFCDRRPLRLVAVSIRSAGTDQKAWLSGPFVRQPDGQRYIPLRMQLYRFLFHPSVPCAAYLAMTLRMLKSGGSSFIPRRIHSSIRP